MSNLGPRKFSEFSVAQGTDNLQLVGIQNGNNVKIPANEVGGDIVVKNYESGVSEVSSIALEMGAIYEMFITSAFGGTPEVPYGQQKITIKLIPAETTSNNYDLYTPIQYFDVDVSHVSVSFIQIYKYETELWNVSVSSPYVKIYKIIKKAV